MCVRERSLGVLTCLRLFMFLAGCAVFAGCGGSDAPSPVPNEVAEAAPEAITELSGGLPGEVEDKLGSKLAQVARGTCEDFEIGRHHLRTPAGTSVRAPLAFCVVEMPHRRILFLKFQRTDGWDRAPRGFQVNEKISTHEECPSFDINTSEGGITAELPCGANVEPLGDLSDRFVQHQGQDCLELDYTLSKGIAETRIFCPGTDPEGELTMRRGE